VRLSFVLSGYYSRDMLMLIRVRSTEIDHILPRHFIFNLVLAKDIVAVTCFTLYMFLQNFVAGKAFNLNELLQAKQLYHTSQDLSYIRCMLGSWNWCCMCRKLALLVKISIFCFCTMLTQ